MVPRLAISAFIGFVFVRSREASSLLVCNLVFPRGGSIDPTVVGIMLNRCCRIKKATFQFNHRLSTV